ncbi:ornithine decarboxylase [Talaromyces islandicus]|uniref:Ornithine decarboxylase n=1 Tax=Talaromyces islandicus TaxID=28573 RepID=A0A0U1MAT1_TALIS|nr:ornithine decarboxylase [Talaromyces islandicus]
MNDQLLSHGYPPNDFINVSTTDSPMYRTVMYPPLPVCLAVENHVSAVDVGARQRNSFLVVDKAVVLDRIRLWQQCLPHISPCHTIRCNSDMQLLQLLAGLSVDFECMSLTEISQVLYLGVDPNRLIFTGPCKDPDEVHHARIAGVRKAVFDNEDELRKLARSHRDAEFYLQLSVHDPACRVRPTKTFGASIEHAKYLFARSRKLRLNIHGLYLPVDGAASNPIAYHRAVACARIAYDHALQHGHSITSIYIGGGFTLWNFEQNAFRLCEAITQNFGSLQSTIRWTAEPGPLWVGDAYFLASRVLGTRDDGENLDLFVNDGVHRNFFHAVVDPPVSKPILLHPRGFGKNGAPPQDARAWTVWGSDGRLVRSNRHGLLVSSSAAGE